MPRDHCRGPPWSGPSTIQPLHATARIGENVTIRAGSSVAPGTHIEAGTRYPPTSDEVER